MVIVSTLLDYLCGSLWEREVAQAIITNKGVFDREFYSGLLAQLVQSTCCVSFERYPEIAKCHVLCVASAPDSSYHWFDVLEEYLEQRVQEDSNLDAYVMGSLMGIFQAGIWLQQHRKRLLPGSTLLFMARYSLALLTHQSELINPSYRNDERNQAQHDLDQAVKGYLRCKDEELRGQLKNDTHLLIGGLRDALEMDWSRMATNGPGMWLLMSIVHSVLNIEHRGYDELIRLALAVTAV